MAGSTSTAASGSAASYTIVSIADLSVKAHSRALSTCSPAEFDALPLNKRLSVDAVLDSAMTQGQVRPTLDAILDASRESHSDVDGITVFLYSEAGLMAGGFDIGSALWAPHGQRGSVTPEIARTSDRSKYHVSYAVRDGVEEYLARRVGDGDLFGLSLEQRRAYFLEVAAAEIRGMMEADIRVDPSADLMANRELADELTRQYISDIGVSYGVNEEQHSAIMVEGVEKRLPLE